MAEATRDDAPRAMTLVPAEKTLAFIDATSDESDNDADFAAELLASSEIASEVVAPPPAIAAETLEIRDVLFVVLSFLPANDLNIASVARLWRDVTQQHVRRKARESAEALMGGKALAMEFEAALYKGCGNRAGVGAYNRKLRSVLSNLLSNPSLQRRVVEGELKPRALLFMSREQMATKAQLAKEAEWRAEALASARIRPRAADVSGFYRCTSCGCDKQWRRYHARHGLVDKGTEVLVCCECTRPIDKFSGAAYIADGEEEDIDFDAMVRAAAAAEHHDGAPPSQKRARTEAHDRSSAAASSTTGGSSSASSSSSSSFR
jgi:hypothetical protein